MPTFRGRPSTTPHVILVGLSGSGKSTIGRTVAGRLNCGFLDFDAEIERRSGMAVARIFAEMGEQQFRALELELTQELADKEGMLLAPGGGWPMIPGAVSLLKPPAGMIYLRTSPEVALRRMGRRLSIRPLLAAEGPLESLSRLLAEREPVYLRADHVVDVDDLDIKEVTEIVSRLASLFMEG